MPKASKIQKDLNKQIKAFEKKNPQIVKSMKLFEMTIKEYDRIMGSISDIKTYVSSGTSSQI